MGGLGKMATNALACADTSADALDWLTNYRHLSFVETWWIFSVKRNARVR